MDTISPFGLNFKHTIVPDKKRITCTVSGYVRGDFQGDAQVVLDLRASGKNVFWAGKDVPQTYCVSNEWQLLSGAFNIPDTTVRWDEVHVFIWLSSKNSGQLWLDDVTISLQ